MDLFSNLSVAYASYRPLYPQTIYRELFRLCPVKEAAYDAGTGNGQVAAVLADVFDQVVSSDISENQMAQAVPKQNIVYQKSLAHESGLKPKSQNLITAAQAAHWFDMDLFWQEVNRIAAPGCIVALWGYGLIKLPPSFQSPVNDLYFKVLQGYWEPERSHIDTHYQNIKFPLNLIAFGNHTIHCTWQVQHLIGYLGTWSAVETYKKKKGQDPLTGIFEGIASTTETISVEFPLFFKVGMV
jgi:SAM-dependent methyltransferase